MQNGTVVKHHAFRRAAGPRGIDDHRRIDAQPRFRALRDLFGRAPVLGKQVIPKEQIESDRLVVFQAFHSDDELDPAGPLRRPQQPVRQLLGRDDYTARTAILENMDVVVLGIRDIRGHRDRADRHDAEFRDQPFGTVFRNDRDPVARIDAERKQRLRHGAGLIGRFAPNDGPILPVVLDPKEVFVAKALCLVEKQFREVRCLGNPCRVT
jgi:hypothetical protein